MRQILGRDAFFPPTSVISPQKDASWIGSKNLSEFGGDQSNCRILSQAISKERSSHEEFFFNIAAHDSYRWKNMWRKIHELNALIGTSDNS